MPSCRPSLHAPCLDSAPFHKHTQREQSSPAAASSGDDLLDVLGQEQARADGLHADRHEGVVCAAQLGALAVVDALAVDGEPNLGDDGARS